MEAPKRVEMGKYSINYFLRKNPYSKHNEDCAGVFHLKEDQLVVAVADGFGGHAHGEKASKAAINILNENLQSVTTQKNLLGAIVDSFEKANSHLLDKFKGSATTFCVSLIGKEQARFFNVGDSQGQIIQKNGKVKFATPSHNLKWMIEEIVPAKNLNKRSVPDNEVVKYLGTDKLVMDVSITMPFHKNEKIGLMSDGLVDNYFNKSYPSRSSSEDIFEELVATATKNMAGEKGKPDDLSLIFVERK